ncbi:MAG: hypothetical protein CMP34_04365 [Rickettsiales bacterium]|nr:hypothetical protein [Rickettsiales bacterium]|tara:strand:+ start:1944 stop:2246 length:303 start_codon:yes stop_codon:yes gene_type:complete
MIPKNIKLSQTKNNLLISYNNGKYLIINASFLRASSPSAENKLHAKNPDPEKYKNIKIDYIEKIGNYAIKLKFDDGHDTGIYSWQYLHDLGIKFQNYSHP